MAMKLIKVNDQEFNNFIKNSNKSHFLQTSAWGEVSFSRHYTIHKLILVNDNNDFLGSALLLEKKIVCYSTFYCPRGFICNFDDDALIIEMIKKRKKSVAFPFGPYLILGFIIINLLIVIHELGHTIIAKYYNFKIENRPGTVGVTGCAR